MSDRKHTRSRHARRGFSLLELTLVILIIGVLMGVATVAFAPALLRGKTTATEASMTTIRRAITEYQGINNQYPAALQALVPGHLEEVPLDGWDNQFWYAAPGQDGRPFDLISAGEDGQYTTADDINVWTMNEEQGQ
ncbi:MAG: type II secretion system protein GspG [Phycisphaerales bacterium]|jgi:general secretion pathway protein G